MKHLVLASALLIATAPSVEAQQLKLELQDGRVTLEANAVPARQILAEWARIGGTKIVGGDKVTGGPLTLKLVNMPERQALDIILRNVAGFMAAPRQASAAPGASAYDRILILATSSAPAQAATPAGRAGAPNAAGGAAGLSGTGRRLPPRPPSMAPPPVEAIEAEPDQPQPEDQADTGVQQAPVFTFPAQGGVNPNGTPNTVFVPMPQNGQGRPGQPGTVAPPVITLQPNANGQPTIYNFVPSTDGGAPPPAASTPFGAVGSATPGMIVQPTPPAPGQPQRPPRQ